MTIRVDASQPRVSAQPATSRITAPPPERRFRAALADGASVLLGGVEVAARALPGGQVMAAALGGARARGAASVAGAGDVEADAAGNGLDLGGNDAMDLLALQQQMQDENRRYSTLSNVMKARHETAKNAIGNIR
ncbi:MAG: hypothetical protein ACK5U8_19530 [Deltaproteobacteria bacterium]